MAKVRTHTRKVNGKRQKVKSHSRKLQPSRARLNARKAVAHGRRRRYGAAVACAGVAAAEVGGWFALRGAGLALVTIGIAALGAGVAARRATPSTPKPVRRSPGTIRPAQDIRDRYSNRVVTQRPPTFYEQGRQARAVDNRAGGYDHSVATPEFNGENDPRRAEWNRGYTEGSSD